MLLLMAGATVSAQENRPAPRERRQPTAEQMTKMAQMQTQRLTKALKLDETQAQQVEQLYIELGGERMKLWQEMPAFSGEMTREQAEAARKQMREKNEALRQAEAEKMKAILTTQQFMKWSKMQEQQRRPGGDRMGRPDGPGGFGGERPERPQRPEGEMW